MTKTKDERQAHSLADQEAALRQFAAERGERIVRVYSDQASGTDAKYCVVGSPR